MANYLDAMRKQFDGWHELTEVPENCTQVILAEYDDMYENFETLVYMKKGVRIEIETGLDKNRFMLMSENERINEALRAPETMQEIYEDGFYMQEIKPEAPYCVEPERIVKREISTNYKYKWCYVPQLIR